MPDPRPIPRRCAPRRTRPAVRMIAGAALLLLARSASAAVAQPETEKVPDEAAVDPSRLNAGTDGAGFPEPFWLSLVTVAGAGTAGAAVARRIAGGGRRHGWAAGALSTLAVGTTAAVAALTLNPPGGAWWSLAATAAAAGLGAEAVAVLAARGQSPETRAEGERRSTDPG